MNLFERAKAREKGKKVPERRNANVKTFGDLDSIMPLVIGTRDHSVEEYIVFYSKKL
ncbi:MAG: hypothetical protein ACC656_00500 [Candidatus Heimdallarchaeota archaeon]